MSRLRFAAWYDDIETALNALHVGVKSTIPIKIWVDGDKVSTQIVTRLNGKIVAIGVHVSNRDRQYLVSTVPSSKAVPAIRKVIPKRDLFQFVTTMFEPYRRKPVEVARAQDPREYIQQHLDTLRDLAMWLDRVADRDDRLAGWSDRVREIIARPAGMASILALLSDIRRALRYVDVPGILTVKALLARLG